MQSSRTIDIRKAAAVIIRDRKLLVCREYDHNVFVAPGGKLDGNETPLEAVVRELEEELNVHVEPTALREFGVFYAEAATNPGSWLEMTTYMVEGDIGKLTATSEIEELAWLGSVVPAGMKVGSIFEHEVLPRLKQANLID